MGAWGEGMQANDSAMDSVAMVKRRLPKRDYGNPKKVLAAISAEDKDDHHGILGAAECLLDELADMSLCLELVDKSINYEIGKDRLECWTDPAERKAALLRFKAAIHGEEKDKKAREDDNMGLMAKIAGMPRRSEIDAMIARKNILVQELQSEMGKKSPNAAKVKACAIVAATAEFEVATCLLASDEDEDAAANVVSLVSLLVNATQKPSAKKMLLSVLRQTFK